VAVKNATGISCVSGACGYAACQSFHLDSDNNPGNGCEGSCGELGVAPCCPTSPQCRSGGCNPGHGYCK
jgi:hypothetical protein